jgi:hypothetical protein
MQRPVRRPAIPAAPGPTTAEHLSAARVAARAAAIDDTRTALRGWVRRPSQLLPWFGLSAIITAILLLAVYVVSVVATPEATTGKLIAADPSARLSDVVFVVRHNLVVLLLHLMVCFATYLVRRSLPLQAEALPGFQGWIHRHASAPALLVVVALTVSSILLQALSLGHALADLAAQSPLTQAGILVRLLPHALPELLVVFLPLAAALWLEREGRTHDLLAAVVACAVVAMPVILVSAVIEVVIASAFF